jgi:hypothetical protein
MDSEVFALNNAVDELWKKELDSYRKKQEAHPLLATSTNNAIPFAHDQLYNWQNYKQGIRFIDKLNQFELYGVIDDILINDKKELIIIDYKSTSNPLNVTCSPYTLVGRYNQMQVSFYAFILQQNGFNISNKAFLIYNLALKNSVAFNQKLEFEINILPCLIDYSWIDPMLANMKQYLSSTHIPSPSPKCGYCAHKASDRLLNNITTANYQDPSSEQTTRI